jgi:hypothetical protein
MGQATLPVRARSLGRNLLPSVALAVWLLATGSGAAPQNPNPPDVQAPKGERRGVNPPFLLHPGRSQTPASGGEPEKAPKKTFVDMTPGELAREVPELKHLEPAENQDLLPQILKGAGAAVAAFFDNLASTTCTEHVTSMVGDALKSAAMHYDNKYNYVTLPQPGALKGHLREYRTNANGEPVEPDAKAGVVTVGFNSLSVHFYPDYQSDSVFRYLGREPMEKQDAYVVAFAQRPLVARQTAYVNFFGRRGTIYMQGVAWIEPTHFRILRLHLDLLMPEMNVGLSKETTVVLYSEVNFAQNAMTLWLPREVTVSGQLTKYVFHNHHRYSDYRLFKVQVDQKHDNP